MAKAKQSKKTAKSKAGRKQMKRPTTKKIRTKRQSAKTKRRASLRGFEVASVTSGTKASTLNPRGQLVVEREQAAAPRAHRGTLSGDLQGISRRELYDSESVSELAGSGQDLEAELIEGVEQAPDADQGEVRVHEVPQPNTLDHSNSKKI